jgi:hypothetical protein
VIGCTGRDERASGTRYPGADLSEGVTDAPPPDGSTGIDLLRVAALMIAGEHDLPDDRDKRK